MEAVYYCILNTLELWAIGTLVGLGAFISIVTVQSVVAVPSLMREVLDAQNES